MVRDIALRYCRWMVLIWLPTAIVLGWYGVTLRLTGEHEFSNDLLACCGLSLFAAIAFADQYQGWRKSKKID